MISYLRGGLGISLAPLLMQEANAAKRCPVREDLSPVTENHPGCTSSPPPSLPSALQDAPFDCFVQGLDGANELEAQLKGMTAVKYNAGHIFLTAMEFALEDGSTELLVGPAY